MRTISNKIISSFAILILLFNISTPVIYGAIEEVENIPNNQITTVSTTVSEEKTYEDFKYKIHDNTYIEITKYIGADTQVIVPETIEDYTVQIIGNKAFEECMGIIHLKLPNSITTIGEWTFSNCRNMEQINFPINCTEIGFNAFYRCEKLTKIEIPEGVTKIPDEAFYYLESLEEVILPSTLTEIGEKSFIWCKKLTKIQLPDSVIKIGAYAFQSCESLTKINFPLNCTQIGRDAFYNCEKLTKIEVPEGVTYIPSYAFASVNYLEEIILPSTLEGIGNRAFECCKNLTKIQLSDKVTSIGNYAFTSCMNLEQINYPLNCIYIGEKAFMGCEKLTKIEVPEGVIKIPDNAFSSIKYLKEITLPSTLEEIGEYAFSGCINLTELKLPNEVTKIGKYAFANCTNLTQMNYPLSCDEIGNSAFIGCENLTKIEIPEGVTQIPNNAFISAGPYLKEITLPSTLKEIGKNAFYGCNNLTINCSKYSKSCIDLIDGGYTKLKFNNDTRINPSNVLDDNNSSYATIYNSNYNRGSIDITCEYSIKKFDAVENITIKIPNNGEFVYDSLYLNGEVCQNFTEDQSNGLIIIPISEGTGTITLSIKALDENNILSYALVNYSIDNESNYDIIGIINNEGNNLSIETASKTNSKNILISGIGLASQDVEIYINETYVTTVKTNKVGSYSANITLPNVVEGEKYTLKAKSKNGRNEDIYATTQVEYFSQVPVMTGFEMIYKEKTYNLLQNERSNIIFDDNEKPVFKITLTKLENVKNVYVTSDRNGSTKKIEAKWNEEEQAYITTDYFDDIDSSYVLGRLNVYYIDMNTTYLKANSSDVSVLWCIDPSGYVYEAVTTNRLEGVQCNLYYLDRETYQEVFWNAEEYNQINPLLTDSEGRYAWDVPEGSWLVKYTLEGYETCASEWMDVPPPQTDVNIGLVSKTKPTVEIKEITSNSIKIEFSKYMKPETVSNITIKDKNGNNVTYILEYSKDETSTDGTIYAKEFILKTSSRLINKEQYSVVIPNTVKTYADVSIEETTLTARLELAYEPGDINGDGAINARDAKLAIQHFTGKIELTDEQILRADVYSDGTVNARDAKLIIQFFTGKISNF